MPPAPAVNPSREVKQLASLWAKWVYRLAQFRRGILDRDGEDLVDGVQLEVFDVPVSVPPAAIGLVSGRLLADAPATDRRPFGLRRRGTGHSFRVAKR